MKKFHFLSGVLVGFVLGSRAGKGAYNDLESLARNLAARPEVRKVVDQAMGTANAQATSLAHQAGHRVSSTVTSLIRRDPTARGSYADPQDLQFGSSAADKEKTLDRMLDRGVSPDALHDEPASARPRAGAKAEPTNDE